MEKTGAGRDYYVLDNEWIYYTPDMDETLRWFTGVLGWFGEILDRDPSGGGTYGFVCGWPLDWVRHKAVPFRGIHLWPGEPVPKTLALIQVNDVEALMRHVTAQGWEGVGALHETGVSPKTCEIITPDGSVLTFFQ